MAEKSMQKRSFKDRIFNKNNLFRLIFLLGFLIAIYPLVSQYYYGRVTKQEVSIFETEKEKLPPEEVEERMELARAYNEVLDPTLMADPFDERHTAGRAEYARMLEVKERIGHVQIPRIKQDISIYAGTSPTVLEKGAGHLEGSSLPVGGINTHTVITAHRGLPSIRLFTDLDKLEIGDKFYIHNIGDVLCYRVDQILTVEPTDFDPVMIVPGEDYATLLTCTPYMINSHRLLVRGVRIPYVPAVEEREIEQNEITNLYRNLFFATATILALTLIKMAWDYYKKRKKENNKKQNI